MTWNALTLAQVSGNDSYPLVRVIEMPSNKTRNTLVRQWELLKLLPTRGAGKLPKRLLMLWQRRVLPSANGRLNVISSNFRKSVA